MSDPLIVSVENFVRVETNRMLSTYVDQIGLNTWFHYRAPSPLDQQDVIRMNRDTLYSAAVVDVSGGATLVLPDAGERYLSVMAINQDHYVTEVFHEPGEHALSMDVFGTEYVILAARILVNASDPEDITEVNRLQDQLGLQAASAIPFDPPVYDETSYKTTYHALVELGRGVKDLSGAYGTKDRVDPIKHLVASAFAWGGLPVEETIYMNVEPGLPVGNYELEVKDAPVDAFWSITVYDKDGFLEPNELNVYNVNNIFGVPNDDGSFTVRFGDCQAQPNCLPTPEGWNYIIRLYRPRPELTNGTWTFPAITA